MNSRAHYVVRPLTAAARSRVPDSPVRRLAPFRSTWTKTESQLCSEVAHLGAREFVLMGDVEESDLRIDGRLRANARPASPTAAVAFESRDRGSLMFVAWKFSHFEANVRAIALGLESLRRVDRYGITESGEQYAGWRALPSGTPMPSPPMTWDEAVELLDRFAAADWDAMNPDAIQAAWRRAARALHPDAGGDAASFNRVSEARDLLLGVAQLARSVVRGGSDG